MPSKDLADDTRARGWSPVRGIPPAARSEKTPESLHKGSTEFAGRVKKEHKPPTPRGSQSSGSTRIHGGNQHRSARDGMQAQRNQRHSRGGACSLNLPCRHGVEAPAPRVRATCDAHHLPAYLRARASRRAADYKTESERCFQPPDNFEPAEDEYGRPVRRLYSGRIKKRVRACARADARLRTPCYCCCCARNTEAAKAAARAAHGVRRAMCAAAVRGGRAAANDSSRRRGPSAVAVVRRVGGGRAHTRRVAPAHAQRSAALTLSL